MTQSEEPLRAAAGVMLGARYELLAPLGRGGTAEVWRARDTLLARAVAIKLFHHDSTIADADTRRSGEVRLLAGLNHPGLVAVYDAAGMTFGAGRDTYLVMELVEGESLHRRLQSGPLAPPAVCDLGQQLGTTLAYLHEHRVVHRDIKPANILLSETSHGPQVKLTDFGIARLLDSARVTVDGATIGTPNYLSPEQVLGRDVGPPSDVYTLGLVLLEALSGRLCYPGHGVEAALARLHRAPVVPRQLEPAWHELLPATTAADPAARPSAQHVADVLHLIAIGARPTQLLAVPAASPSPGGPGTAPTTASAATPATAPATAGVLPAAPVARSRRRRGALIAGLGGAAAALAVVLTVAAGGNAPVPHGPAPADGSTSAAARPSSPPSHPSTPRSSSGSSSGAVNVPVVASTTRRRAEPGIEVSLTLPTRAAPRPASKPHPHAGKPGKASKPKPGKKP